MHDSVKVGRRIILQLFLLISGTIQRQPDSVSRKSETAVPCNPVIPSVVDQFPSSPKHQFSLPPPGTAIPVQPSPSPPHTRIPLLHSGWQRCSPETHSEVQEPWHRPGPVEPIEGQTASCEEAPLNLSCHVQHPDSSESVLRRASPSSPRQISPASASRFNDHSRASSFACFSNSSPTDDRGSHRPSPQQQPLFSTTHCATTAAYPYDISALKAACRQPEKVSAASAIENIERLVNDEPLKGKDYGSVSSASLFRAQPASNNIYVNRLLLLLLLFIIIIIIIITHNLFHPTTIVTWSYDNKQISSSFSEMCISFVRVAALLDLVQAKCHGQQPN